MCKVLHNWSLERKKLLIRKAYDALPANGVFLEVNSIVDDTRRDNMGGLELSLTQLVEFGHEQAFVYTFKVSGSAHVLSRLGCKCPSFAVTMITTAPTRWTARVGWSL